MVGYPFANLGGFLNNPNVPAFTLPTGDWLNPATTVTQILADLRAWEEFVITTSGEGGSSGQMYPNVLALPGAEVSRLGDNAGVGTDTTIWDLFATKQSQGVREGKVGEWRLVRTPYAEDILNTRRGTMYHMDRRVVRCENPLAYEELAPQERNLHVYTPMVGRTAGVVYLRPAMSAYAAVG